MTGGAGGAGGTGGGKMWKARSPGTRSDARNAPELVAFLFLVVRPGAPSSFSW